VAAQDDRAFRNQSPRGLWSAAAQEPIPVSPGRLVGSPSSASACPVFNFSGVEGAVGYELVALGGWKVKATATRPLGSCTIRRRVTVALVGSR
jgi:hypothetical protein